MNYFIRNIVLIHVVLLAVAFGWIHGGTRPDLLLPVVPWLTFFVFEFLMVFPQAKSTETLAEARSRVWGSLWRDPLLYFSLLLTAYLVIPLFNVAGYPAYDAAAHVWRNPHPPLPWLPSCGNANHHAVLLLWFPPVLMAALAAKHGLLKKGKRLLLECLCWNGAALALFGFIQQMTDAKSIFWGKETFSFFFSTFGYPNFAGAFFTLLFAVSTGLWFTRASEDILGVSAGSGTRQDEVSFIGRHYLLVAVFLNFIAAIASLSRAAILLCTVLSIVLGLYMVAGFWQKAEQGGHFKILAVIGGALFVLGIYFTVFAPKTLKNEVASITPKTVFERVSGRGYYHARVAKDIFRDHLGFGVGGWGYPYYVQQYLKPEEFKVMQVQGGANVHNDTLQFLAEHGAVGYGLMVLCVGALVVPLVRQAFRVNRAAALADAEATHPPKPAWLYRLPPVLVAGAVGTLATVCHSLGDLPFRDPAIVIVWVLVFACAPGFLPAVRK